MQDNKARLGNRYTCFQCGTKFYDLNRDPIVCPICETVYKLDAAPTEAVTAAPTTSAKRPAPEPAEPLMEGDEALPAMEGDDEAVTTEEDETFLEAEEEDGSDMTNIIGGPVAEGEEPDR